MRGRYKENRLHWPNERLGVDAGWRVPFAFQRPQPRAIHCERSATEHAR